MGLTGSRFGKLYQTARVINGSSWGSVAFILTLFSLFILQELLLTHTYLGLYKFLLILQKHNIFISDTSLAGYEKLGYKNQLLINLICTDHTKPTRWHKFSQELLTKANLERSKDEENSQQLQCPSLPASCYLGTQQHSCEIYRRGT